jgi:hypothetical protein
MSGDPNNPVQLSNDEKVLVVERKATCPFIASAISEGHLAVRNEAKDPLASIEEVRRLGNTGGGDLGDLLVFFASGNHAFMRGNSAKLESPAPSNLFSLEFPGSQGSHPGHSGILQGDPETLDSGRLSEANFNRLAIRAQGGFIKRSDVGRFIAENLVRDPKSKVFGKKTLALLAGDLGGIFESGLGLIKDFFRSHRAANHRELEEKLTKLLGEDNMVGSAGEFGLLFAFLANKPGAQEIMGEPALDMQDVKSMFVDKRLPDGWDTWKKSRIDWVTNTTALLIAAAKEYRALKGMPKFLSSETTGGQ